VWASLDGMMAADALVFVQRTEKRGFGALWTPQSRGAGQLSLAKAWAAAQADITAHSP
jgi:hypothetical protein